MFCYIVMSKRPQNFGSFTTLYKITLVSAPPPPPLCRGSVQKIFMTVNKRRVRRCRCRLSCHEEFISSSANEICYKQIGVESARDSDVFRLYDRWLMSDYAAVYNLCQVCDALILTSPARCRF